MHNLSFKTNYAWAVLYHLLIRINKKVLFMLDKRLINATVVYSYNETCVLGFIPTSKRLVVILCVSIFLKILFITHIWLFSFAFIGFLHVKVCVCTLAN